MRIHCIFEEIKNTLYAVAYDDIKSNILDELQENWTNPVWLEEFFESNKSDLQSGFYGKLAIEDAIEQTINQADDLFLKLKENDGSNLSSLFKPLDERDFQIKDFQEQKAKGIKYKSWIRIYAVHFYDMYVITGGAIKLTHKMDEREHTNNELKKLKIVRDALKHNEADSLYVYLDI